MRKILFSLSLLWVVAAFALAFYEHFTEAGLYARLLGWQLETFGSARVNLTVIVTGVIYGLPGLIAMSLTRSGGPPPDPVAGQRNAAVVCLAFGVVLVVVGIAGYVISVKHAAGQSAAGEVASAPRLVSVDLDAGGGIPPAGGADGVSVTGWLQRGARYELEEQRPVSKKTVFCPFVGERWSASDPVKVFLRADPSAPIALRRTGGGPPGVKPLKGFVAVDFAPPTPLQVTIEGTTRPGALPAYAASFFGKQGLKVASDYVVLEAKPFFEAGRRSEWEKFAATSHWLTYITVPIGLFVSLLSLVPFVRWRRQVAARRVVTGASMEEGA